MYFRVNKDTLFGYTITIKCVKRAARTGEWVQTVDVRVSYPNVLARGIRRASRFLLVCTSAEKDGRSSGHASSIHFTTLRSQTITHDIRMSPQRRHCIYQGIEHRFSSVAGIRFRHGGYFSPYFPCSPCHFMSFLVSTSIISKLPRCLN